MAGFWSKLFSGEDKPSSARTAKDRLKVIVASEQGLGRRLSQDKIDQMKTEIMQVVNRYVRGVYLYIKIVELQIQALVDHSSKYAQTF